MKTSLFTLHAEMDEKHWWFLGRRKIVEKLIRRAVPASKTETILDIGCGTGGTLAPLAADYRCMGIDNSPEAIRLAQEQFPGIPFLCGSFSPEMEGVRQASVFLLMDVLEHVEDDFLLFSKVLSAAKPGAHLLLTVPADARLWSAHDVNFGHYRRYDLDRFTRLWKGYPVSPLLVSYYNAYLYPVVRWVRLFSGPFGHGGDGTDLHLPPGPVNALLEKLFASEARLLVDLLEKKRLRGFSRGVSLIALLRREPGRVEPRSEDSNGPP
ncbi:MAG: class I SAM-dependent methyltransferase [Candidatus Omnitrophica bacterium]|nr:class I SAM-dependent methyltransferase [Candidatus Omnitrophota bacterium]